MARQVTDDDLELLAEAVAAEMDDEPFDPGTRHEPEVRKPWRPLLNPTQELAFNDNSRIIGLCGPRYSGKTILGAEKIVRHCYEEWNALFTIIGSTIDALKDGVCEDLTSFVIPQWRDGNRESKFIRKGGILVPNPREGQLIDHGMGLDATGWRQDSQTKHIYLKIKNRFGGWSRVKVISIPFPKFIDARTRGPAPSGIYLEEATKCESDAYFKYPNMNLNRRRDIIGAQQFIFSCNPEGTDNWVYKWMYKDVKVNQDQPGRVWPNDPEEPGIRRRPKVSFYFVAYTENAHNVSQENRENLEDSLRTDPILRKRLEDGRWVDYPSGEAIFKDQFKEDTHIKGNWDENAPLKNRGLLPIIGTPIVLGYDFGPRSMGVSIGQCVETEDGPVDLIFDEFCFHRKHIKARTLARGLLEKLRFWNNWLREQTEDPTSAWPVWHIAGDDATTMMRQETGSTDARSIQDHTRQMIEEDPVRYAGIEPFLIRGCPRPPGSKEKRVDLVADALVEDRLYCSALCREHRDMFFHLERDKDSPNTPKGGTKHIHTFDAMSYRIYYRRFVLPKGFYDIKTPTVTVSV